MNKKEVKNYIVYIGQLIPPDKNAVAQRVYANAKLIKMCGYVPVVVGCDKDVDKLTKIDDCYAIETYVLPYPNTTKQWADRMISIDNYIEVFHRIGTDKIAAVITCDLQALAQGKLRKYLKKRNIAYIEDTMEWIRHSRNKSIKTLIKDVDTYFRMSYAHIKTNNIICISDYLYQYYSKRQCTVTKIPVLIEHKDPKWEIDAEYMPNPERTFVYAGDAGSIGYKERLDNVVIAACKLFDEGVKVRVEIIGMERNAFAEKCPQIASHKNFDAVCFFYGRKPHLFCLDRIKKADASILIRENSDEMKAGFPTKLSETLRLGTPPLVTFIGDYSEYIADGIDCIRLYGTSVEETYHAMKKVCYLSELELKSLHLNCERNRNFDIEKYVDRMSEFLDKCIKAKEGKSNC